MVPVLNKIDLPQADAMGVAQEIEDIVGIEASMRCNVRPKPVLALKKC